jgi:hypothetical protein
MSKHDSHRHALLRVVQCVFYLLPACAFAVSVEDFGALGDGVTWDHAAIQAAMNAAGDGGEVEFVAGKTYIQCKQLLPRPRQTIRGNGAVLKRCDAVTATLLQEAQAGARTLIVDDPSAFELGQSLTPVKGAGGATEGESVISHYLQLISGNQITIQNPLLQSYPAGSIVTAKFDQLYIANLSTDVTVENLVFDGNRARNNLYLAWTDNKAIRGYSGLTVSRSTFRYLPGNGITVFGTRVVIDRNGFHDLDGPALHLSGNDPINGSSVVVSNNGMRRTNAQAARMQHSEGVITISAFNNSIRILRNTVINAPVPFISRFHADMRDWLIRGNTVYGTQGVFIAKVWPGSALSNVVWEDNSFFNTGEGHTIWNPGAELITGFTFRNNRFIGGNLRLDRLTQSEILANTIKSCRVAPLALTNSPNVVVSGNIEDAQYCPLRLQVTPSPGAGVKPGDSVSFAVSVANAADPLDVVTTSGITVRTLTDSLSGANLGAACAPRLPVTLRAGETLNCSVARKITRTGSVPVKFTAEGKLGNGSAVQGTGVAIVLVR